MLIQRMLGALIQLRKASARALREAITDGWLACAPPDLAASYPLG